MAFGLSRPKVDLKELYYLDDDEYFDSSSCYDDNSLSIYPISLHVSYSSELCNHLYIPNTPWILDICLDYFTVNNPFYLELVQLMKDDFQSHPNSPSSSISVESAIQLIIRIYAHLPYRLEKSTAKRTLCHHLWEQIFTYPQPENQNILEMKTEALDYRHQFVLLFDETIQMKIQTTLFTNILPFLSESTCEKIRTYKQLLLLPHHPIDDFNIIQQEIDQIENELRHFIQLRGLPLCVTIATSILDGYTPHSISQSLQSNVMTMLQKVMIENQHELVVHDLSEECIEKADHLFYDTATRWMFLK
jgi:hypothetical protein